MSRRLAREAAMCLLFERDMTGEAGEDTLREMEDVLHTAQIEAQHESYINKILALYDENHEQLDSIIERYCRSWKLDRLPRVDISILRLAMIELLYLKDEVPKKVAINEAVELAKKFSHEKAPKFINGVLGAFVADEGP